ncbi:hypothetical protein DSECCO2_603910 [anaerobic digester metagenome]
MFLDEQSNGIGEHQDGDSKDDSGNYQGSNHKKVECVLETEILLFEEKCRTGAQERRNHHNC